MIPGSELSTLLFNVLMVMFNATAGWYYSKVLKANTGINEDELKQFTVKVCMLMTMIVTLVFRFDGYLVA